MINNIFEVNEGEKNRILNLHESATKRHYLSEDEDSEEMSIDIFPPSKEDIRYGWDLLNKITATSGYQFWAEQKKLPKSIIKKFIIVDDAAKNDTNADDNTVGIIGRYFRKHPNAIQ